MSKILLWVAIAIFATLCFWIQPVEAKPAKIDATLLCFSGGREIARKNVIQGPFADEYKFGHEVKVRDEKGEHNLNFSGGLCIIDLGSETLRRKSPLSDLLSCYSGKDRIVDFEVYGLETTIDEYLEGRTFLAKASGNYFNSDSLHRYLIFGGAACIGEETN